MDVIPKLAFSVREYEVEIAPRADQLPLPQRVHDIGSDRDRTLAGLADLAKAVGALAHMDLAPPEIDILPAQAT